MPRLASMLFAAAVAAAACGRPVRSLSPLTPDEPGPRRDAVATPAPVGTAVANADLLASLALTGADWEQRLAEIPVERARAVAIAFLREGRLACRSVVTEEVECGDGAESFAPVAADATLADPCLRRHVAVWALATLEATDVAAIADTLATLVVLPQPEQELMDELVALIPPGDDPLRLRLISAAADGGRADVADALLAGLTPAGAAHALVALGREAAIAHLGDRGQTGTLAAALDGGLSRAAALDALDRLEAADLDEPVVAAAVRATAVSDDCEVAARAAVLLDDAGDDQYLPSRAPLTTEADATRALCVASHVSAAEAMAVLRPLIAGDGLELVAIQRRYDVDSAEVDPDLDGDGDPQTSTSRERLGLADLVSDIVDWLPTSCGDGVCHGPAGTVTLSFGRGTGRALQLDAVAVERFDEGCGC